MEQRVLARLKLLGPPAGAVVTVGFSGGADSLALAAVLARVAPIGAIEVVLVHVDHGLRPDSAKDAAGCGQLATDLGSKFVLERVSAPVLTIHPGVGVEEAARRARYVALARSAEANGSSIVATAHHQEDQAETVLLHLLRGAGLNGACGMSELTQMTVPWWEPLGETESRTFDLWRPLLAEPRATVRDYAKATGLTPVEDASNDDLRFRRNRIRNEVLPLLRMISPGADAALARYARIASAEDDLIESVAASALARTTGPDSTLAIQALRNERLAVRRRVVLAWLHGCRVSTEVTLERIDAVLEAIERPRRGCRIEVGGGWSVVVEGGTLSVQGPSARGNRDVELAGEGREAR
ncbi:MAG TPA: tRNA lysidine(34) synthetase TilS [Thermomicrobiales bacterium]